MTEFTISSFDVMNAPYPQKTGKMKDKFSLFSGIKGCFIAGGAITSLVTNAPINDYDFYPKTHKALEDLIIWLFESGYYNSWVSDRALTFVTSDTIVQIMLFDTFETAEKIFDFFDFTCCMAAYDLDTEKFIFHDNFLMHCSQRFLSFNTKTKFPYASANRVKKYEERGFTIGKMEYFKILLACQAMPITSWDQLKEQIGGVYGESMIIPEDTEYSFEGALNVISSMVPVTDRGGYKSADEAILNVSGRDIKYIKLSEYAYLVEINPDVWEKYSRKPKNGVLACMADIFPNPVFYKKVLETNTGELTSIHYKQFKYKVGEEVVSGPPHIFCFKKYADALNYSPSSRGSKVIKLVAKHEDIVYDGTSVTLKRAMVEDAY
jgi:hypothetical protein